MSEMRLCKTNAQKSGFLSFRFVSQLKSLSVITLLSFTNLNK